jgi:hypothetical protein
VAWSAATLPAADIFRIFNAENTLMRLFLLLFKRLAAMTGDAVVVVFGSKFKILVTTNAGGLLRLPLATGQEL